jgi:putative hydrolase of the HAD superfamily
MHRTPDGNQETELFPFDVILFDIGGVLLTNGWDRTERAQGLSRFGLDRAAFEALHASHYDAWDRGTITVQQYMEATVFTEPRSFFPDEFFAAICAQSRVLPDSALPVLRELAAKRPCLIGALNNEARETNAYRLDTFGLRPLFEVTLTSSYLGLRKPEPAIYHLALEILSRPAERILFIDDREENIASAAEAGLHALLFTGEAKLRDELARLGI